MLKFIEDNVIYDICGSSDNFELLNNWWILKSFCGL